MIIEKQTKQKKTEIFVKSLLASTNSNSFYNKVKMFYFVVSLSSDF